MKRFLSLRIVSKSTLGVVFCVATTLALSQETRYVSDTYGQRIRWYDAQGSLQGQFGLGQLLGPTTLIVRRNTLYVLDVVTPFAPNSVRLARYSLPSRKLVGYTLLQNEVGSIGYGSEMVISRSGVVYISNGLDTLGPGFVDAFDISTGARLNRYFQKPDAGSRAVALSQDEEFLFVGSYWSNDNGKAVYVHDLPNPFPMKQFAPIGLRVQDILVRGNIMYVAGQGSFSTNDYIQAWRFNTNATFTFLFERSLNTVFGSARSLAVDTTGALHLVVNSLPESTGYVKRFSDTGSGFADLGDYGLGDARLPQGAVIARTSRRTRDLSTDGP